MRRFLITALLTISAAAAQAGDNSICKLCGKGEVCAYEKSSDTYYCKASSSVTRAPGKGIVLSPTKRLRSLSSQ
ncbi:hypothetical protein [Antarctobacter jejuensis]|uniref:hypothetical protein n=1 Tax=Antarctobacter jejuensis TaxID=1439938 RepID=UPI003FD23A4A